MHRRDREQRKAERHEPYLPFTVNEPGGNEQKKVRRATRARERKREKYFERRRVFRALFDWTIRRMCRSGIYGDASVTKRTLPEPRDQPPRHRRRRRNRDSLRWNRGQGAEGARCVAGTAAGSAAAGTAERARTVARSTPIAVVRGGRV